MPDQSLGVPPPLYGDQYQSYLDMQRQQLLAQMLMGNAQQANQTPENWNSMRVVPHRSAGQNISALIGSALAGRQFNKALQSQGNYYKGFFPQQGASGGAPLQAAPQSSDPNDQNVQPLIQRNPGQSFDQTVQAASPQPSRTSMFGTQPGQAETAYYMNDPKGYLEKIMGPRILGTPEWQNALRATGGDESAAAQLMLSKMTKEGTIDLRSGAAAIIPGRGIVRNPQLATGETPITDQNGNVVGTRMLPGHLGNVGALEGAEAAARAVNTPHEDPMHPGSYTYPQPPSSAQGKYFPPGTSGAATGDPRTPGNLTGARKEGEAGIDYSTRLVEGHDAALGLKQNLQEMRNLAPQIGTNAGAHARITAAAWAQAMGIPHDTVVKFFGLDPGSAQAMEKLTGQLAVSSIKTMTSRGTQFEFANFMKMNPNSGMTPGGFSKVLDYMDKQADVPIDRFNDFADWRASHPNREDWQVSHTAHWSQVFNANLKAGKYTVGNVEPTTRPGANLQTPQMNELPSPAQARGRTIRDTQTGQLLTSDGQRWIPKRAGATASF